jgi:hypothetical protein
VLLALVLATVAGALAFWVGARFRHEGDADLPRYLDRPVDPDVDHEIAAHAAVAADR